MDSPNVKVRRHNSLPASARCSSLLLRMSHKSNPYVGTFRHSPVSSMQQQHSEFRLWRSLDHAKNSPYVGTMRHAPVTITTLQAAVCRLLLEQSYRPKQMNGFFQIKDLLNGRLLGGTTATDVWEEVHRTMSNRKDSSSSSGTVQVISRLVCWLLMPFQPETSSAAAKKAIKNHAEWDETEEDASTLTDSLHDGGDGASCWSSDEDEIDYDGPLQYSSPVLSSLAEAYYAHQATTTTASSKPEQPDRLDYTITQMDVIRMMRNASRHLDVTSIVQLPVYTYHAKPTEDASWLLVPNDNENDKDVCVICLEHFVPNDRLRVLPCNHSFHVGCIDRWLSGSHSFDDCVTSGCPLCKKAPFQDCSSSDDNGSVPSWAFARIGDALVRNSMNYS